MPGMEARAPERTETSRGVLRIAKLFAGDLFQLGHIFHDLRLDLGGDLLAVVIIAGCRLRW